MREESRKSLPMKRPSTLLQGGWAAGKQFLRLDFH
jgi:hypothetical protein